ncbi:hypothetical protein MRX96_033005 [Rhipicephalus microplus]
MRPPLVSLPLKSRTIDYVLASQSDVVNPSWTWAVPPVLVVLLFGLLLAIILIPARESGTRHELIEYSIATGVLRFDKKRRAEIQ